MIDITVHGVDELAADLRHAGAQVGPRVREVTQASAERIRDTARALAPRKALPHYARSITYETSIDPGGVTAEIGPDKDKKQGPLGNILEYGTARTAPHAHLGPAFDIEQPRWVASLEDVLRELL